MMDEKAIQKAWAMMSKHNNELLLENEELKKQLMRKSLWYAVKRAERGERKTIVNQGLVYRCTKCNLLFLTKTAGEQHDCRERL